MTERTLILVKPDGVARDLIGEVLGRFERKGLKVIALELRTVDEATARQHYAEHDGQPFFPRLVEFITSGPLVAAVLEGEEAIANARNLMGATNPVTSAPGSIRGDLATVMERNIVHGSDSPESALREIGLFFPSL